MSPIPQYIGPQTPQQIVKIRLGRLSRYYQDNPVHFAAEGEEPNGSGHQTWTGPFCQARVGKLSGPGANPFYAKPWQAKWYPTTDYVTIPNVLEVKLTKQMEGQVGAIGQATIEIENILYAAKVGGYHQRERGAMSPLKGFLAGAGAYVPDIAALVKEWLEALEAAGEPFSLNEWEGRFAYAAQVTVWQGFGEALKKTFTGLIEDLDSTSKPDRITLTARDFGQVFTDNHFFGWGKDPVISTPVCFIDVDQAESKEEVGYNAASSDEDSPTHTAAKVLDFNERTDWQTNTVHSASQTEYVEIALDEGVYEVADVAVTWAGMEVYMALRPARLTGGFAPTREEEGEGAQDMTEENHWLDAGGWYDPTKKEEQIVPGLHGGNSYSYKNEAYPAGKQSPPIENIGGKAVRFRVGKNSILRLSFRKLHKVEAGENFRAGVKEFHGVRRATLAAVGKEEWVVVKDIADVVRILCQWAGFKEWDIPQTGVKLPKMLVAFQSEDYMAVIKQLCEGIGFIFYMADPTADENSIGVPTFRKTRALSPDTEAEKKLREEGIEANGRLAFKHRGSTRPGLPIPTVHDRELLTEIEVKQSNEPLSSVIRVYGVTLSLPGNLEPSLGAGQWIVYTFRPPWAGNPTYVDPITKRVAPYGDSRLGGMLKDVVHKDPFLSTTDLCRNAAWFSALRQAIESVEATIEAPAIPTLDIDDHLLLMDAGTGVATRLLVMSRELTFVDGEKRKFIMSIKGALIDTPDVRGMVNIINGEAPSNGIGTTWGDPLAGVGSELGYG